MEKHSENSLEIKLRDLFNDISYKYYSDKPCEYIVFLDSEYKKHLNCKFTLINTSKEIIPDNCVKLIGLNGDSILINWVENKGIENIDIYLKVN